MDKIFGMRDVRHSFELRPGYLNIMLTDATHHFEFFIHHHK